MLTKKLQSLLTVKFVLVLLITFIAGQVIATEHAIEHSFEGQTDICFLCDTADNYQHCLNAAEIPENTFSFTEAVLIPGIILIVSESGKNYLARAPPQLH